MSSVGTSDTCLSPLFFNFCALSLPTKNHAPFIIFTSITPRSGINSTDRRSFVPLHLKKRRSSVERQVRRKLSNRIKQVEIIGNWRRVSVSSRNCLIKYRTTMRATWRIMQRIYEVVNSPSSSMYVSLRTKTNYWNRSLRDFILLSPISPFFKARCARE